MADDASPNPQHPPVEGPESELGEVAHEDTRLHERVAALEAREKDLVDRLARLQADFDNFRRRTREEGAQATTRGKEAVMKAILPALDNVERALAHSDDEGLRMVARQIHGGLAAQGLLVLDPEGEAFDAKLHEAIARESRDGVKSGTVIVVAEKGYLLDGRVLRPARVIVSS